MRRLLSTLRWDVVLQFRNGFYFASAFFILVWLPLLSLLPEDGLHPGRVVPALMVMNLLLTTFYFIGALVLLEKAEGTLAGLVLTPLRAREYLASKTLSLTGLAMLESLLIIVPAFGTDFAWLPLLAGMAGLGGIYTSFGFIAIARYDTINEYLFPSIIFVTLLLLPLVDHFALWESPLFYLHPVQPPLLLMRAAFVPEAPWALALGLLGLLGWIALGFGWAHAVFHRFVIRTAGGGGGW